MQYNPLHVYKIATCSTINYIQTVIAWAGSMEYAK